VVTQLACRLRSRISTGHVVDGFRHVPLCERNRNLGRKCSIGWGFAIINFVWWIGIGHAGTLISAILLLLRQEWRTSINRFAEAMTLFAVACAGVFPILHLGRPWFAYWLIPYPNTMDIWPQFRSPLVWDVFAISTYGLVSLLFWFVGLIPDLATLRDRSSSRMGRVIYGILAMGWRGSAIHWHRYDVAYLLLAGLATPLVIRFTPSSASILQPASFPAGTRRSFLRISSPEQFIRDLQWSWSWRSRFAQFTALKISSPCGTCKTWRR
jgi:hypothetical protein